MSVSLVAVTNAFSATLEHVSAGVLIKMAKRCQALVNKAVQNGAACQVCVLMYTSITESQRISYSECFACFLSIKHFIATFPGH